MPEPDFKSFGHDLALQGVALRYAQRLAEELADHFEDLRESSRRSGQSAVDAEDLAEQQLGAARDIAGAVLCRTELMSWTHRHPELARIALPLAFLAMLPLVTLSAGLHHAGSVIRWSCCAMLSALFTSLLLLCMQLSIALQ